MTTMFVWIPRYSYSINAGYYRVEDTDSVQTTNASTTKRIDVTFLMGTTNKDKNGITYAKDYNADNITIGQVTPKIVHPGFRHGNQELPGIWVGKFEASGKDSGEHYVGNGNSSTNGSVYFTDSATYVQIIPNAISWRHITIGEAQYQAMKMGANSYYYGWNNVNTHLIKNSEWGVATYLSYSQYGKVPQINAAGTYSSILKHYYDLFTGAGPKADGSGERYETYSYATNGYYTTLGQLASTTGNVTGIYDMSGGAWDLVAGYLDNKNAALNTGGKSVSDLSTIYFENGELKPQYEVYWDRYEVSAEEREGATIASIVTPDGLKTQAELWGPSSSALTWNDTRKRITDITFNNMKNRKGVGIYETAGSFSFRGLGYTTSYRQLWCTTVADANADIVSYGRAWNNSAVLVGMIIRPFMRRGRRGFYIGCC